MIFANCITNQLTFILLCTAMCSAPAYGATEGEHDNCPMLERDHRPCCPRFSKTDICLMGFAAVTGIALITSGSVYANKGAWFSGWSTLVVDALYGIRKGWGPAESTDVRNRTSSYERPYQQIDDLDNEAPTVIDPDAASDFDAYGPINDDEL